VRNSIVNSTADDTKFEATKLKRHKVNAFAVALAAFALVNVALGQIYKAQGITARKNMTLEAIKNTNYEARQEGPWIWWVCRSFLSEVETWGKAPDVVLFGSSQMGSAIFSAEANHRQQAVDTTDQREVKRLEHAIASRTDLNSSIDNLKAFNFSMGGAMASDHYLISQTLLKPDRLPKVAIIGVNPRDFIDNTLPAASATDSFHFLTPYVDLGKLSLVSYPDVFGLMDDFFKNHLPLKQVAQIAAGDAPPSLGNVATFTNPEGKGLEKDQTTGGIARTAGATKVLQAISGAAGDVGRGFWRLPANPDYLYIDNSHEYIRRYKTTKPACVTGQKAYFEALLSYLQQNKVKTIVIGMPSLPNNKALLPQSFWQSFEGYLAQTSASHGARFISLFNDADFGKHDFLDTVHLNRWGGSKLVDRMAQAVTSDPTIVAALTRPVSQDSRQTAASQSQWH